MTAAVVRETTVGDDMVEATDVPVIEFVGPMPGFPDLTHFALVQLDDAGVLGALRSLEETDIRFLVLPAAFFPDYAVEIDDETVAALEITSAEEVLVLVVVNPGATAGAATANLLAPVLINTRTNRGMQVVLNEELPVRAPLQRAG
jgi:flagellar assembly factor FliW